MKFDAIRQRSREAIEDNLCRLETRTRQRAERQRMRTQPRSPTQVDSLEQRHSVMTSSNVSDVTPHSHATTTTQPTREREVLSWKPGRQEDDKDAGNFIKSVSRGNYRFRQLSPNMTSSGGPETTIHASSIVPRTETVDSKSNPVTYDQVERTAGREPPATAATWTEPQLLKPKMTINELLDKFDEMRMARMKSRRQQNSSELKRRMKPKNKTPHSKIT